MAHAEIRVQNNAIDAIVAAAQQILIECAQPVRHGRQVTGTLPGFKLPRRGHFFAAPSAKKRSPLRSELATACEQNFVATERE